MMGKMRVYDSSKPTEIGWLPYVPSHWNVVDIKRCFSFPKEIIGSDFNNYKVLSLSVNGVIFRDMESGAGKHHSDMGTYQIVRPNSIVLCLFDMDVTPRIVGHSDKTGIITSAYVNIVPKENINSKYYYYYFLLQDFNKYLFSQGTGIRTTLTRSQFGALKIVLPNYEEQTAIARFLDYKLSKINRFVRKKKQLIQLLNEQKAAIINQAVTKGLNPHARMKDSGVEWLGEIPEHWEVRKFSSIISSAELGGNYDSSEVSDGIPVMKMGNLDRSFIKLNRVEYLKKDTTYETRHILNYGDFLFNTRNSADLVGKVSLWRNELPFALYNSNILRVTFKEGISNEYMNYLFNSHDILIFLRLIVKGTTNVSAIYFKDLTKIDIWLPNIDEQLKIVQFIDQETTLLTTTISKIEKEIALVEEYKTALIAEAVTGKIDVRGYVVPEMDVETWHAMSPEEEEELSMAAEEAAEYQTEETE